MPDIGEGVAEAELVEWFVTVGQQVELDQSIAEVLTDKASIELPSPVAGTVRALEYAAGEKVPVGAELVQFDIEGATAPATTVAPESDPPVPLAAPPPEPPGASTRSRRSGAATAGLALAPPARARGRDRPT